MHSSLFFVGLIVIAIVVGTIDWRVGRSTVNSAGGELRAATASYVAELDQRLTQASAALRDLDAGSISGCNGAASGQIAEIMGAVPSVKAIQVFDGDGKLICTNPDLQAVTQSTPVTDDTPGSKPSLDFVSLGTSGVKAIRLTRQAPSAPHGYGAILPLRDLYHRFIRPDWVSQARIRVLISDLEVYRVVGGKLVDMSMSWGPSELMAVPGEWVTVKLEADHFPVYVAVDLPLGQIAAASRPERMLIDIAAGGAGLALLLASAVIGRSITDGRKALTVAIRRQQFAVTYRPVIDLANGRLAGAEAVLHWRQSADRLLAVPEFMPTIDRAGLAPMLFKMVIGRCREDLSAAYRLRPNLTLWLDIGPGHLANPGLAHDLRRGLEGAGIRAHQLVLGISDVDGSLEASGVRDRLREVRCLGVRLALRCASEMDWRASLVADLGLSAVEIDRRVTEALRYEAGHPAEARVHAEAWIETIVDIARNYGVAVVAPGVETTEQGRRLRGLGVGLAHGAAFAPPLSIGSYMALLARSGLGRNEPDQQIKPAA
ncbi:MAG: EAL domain-containing protein [Ancalomicrobiaceae bacterium]|nr:EAL domain-containing protein [Ancalomicrobiaceae bacterium]